MQEKTVGRKMTFLVALLARKRYDAFVLRTGRESDRRCSGVRGSLPTKESPSRAAVFCVCVAWSRCVTPCAAVSATTSAPSATSRRGRCRFWRTRWRCVIDGHESAHTALAPCDGACPALRCLDAVLGHPRAEPAGERAELRPRQRVQLLAVDARWPRRHGRASSRAIASRVLGPTMPSTTRP